VNADPLSIRRFTARKFIELMRSPIIKNGRRVLDPTGFSAGITLAVTGKSERQ
jgi:cysteine synthase